MKLSQFKKSLLEEYEEIKNTNTSYLIIKLIKEDNSFIEIANFPINSIEESNELEKAINRSYTPPEGELKFEYIDPEI